MSSYCPDRYLAFTRLQYGTFILEEKEKVALEV